MRHLFLAVTMLAVPAVAAAQIVAGSIDPGMSRAQVVERLGAPASERSISGFTYLLYENGCERTCGMSDLVTLQGDSVVDAIFRAAERRYTGQSSSPAQGAYGRTRSALAVSREAADRPAPRRGGAGAPASGFALPTEWLAAGGANPPSAAAPPTTVDSIVLDISALPAASAAPKRTPGKSLLPAEWLSDTTAAPPAAAPSAAPAPPPAAAPRKSSLLPAEWLGDAPAAGAAPAAQAAPPPAPAPAKRQSLLPAEWLGETSGAAAPPAKAAPAARPDSTVKKPLIPAEWLTPTPPAGGAPPPRPDSAAARPPAANPFVVSPPATTPPPEA